MKRTATYIARIRNRLFLGLFSFGVILLISCERAIEGDAKLLLSHINGLQEQGPTEGTWIIESDSIEVILGSWPPERYQEWFDTTVQETILEKSFAFVSYEGGKPLVQVIQYTQLEHEPHFLDLKFQKGDTMKYDLSGCEFAIQCHASLWKK